MKGWTELWRSPTAGATGDAVGRRRGTGRADHRRRLAFQSFRTHTREGSSMQATRVKQVVMGIMAILAVLIPDGARAQIGWTAPLLVAPNSPAGFSLMIAEMEPSEGLAGMVAWRQSSAPGSIGFRAGAGEGAGDKFSAFGAFDYSGWIHHGSDSFPLAVAWVTGAGIGIGEDVLLSAPLGASFAYEISADDIWFNPYITPMIVFDWLIGAPSTADNADLGIAVDIGADVSFASSWAIRIGATVGDRRGVALGIHFPGVGP